MTSSQAPITVIIPVHNGERYLGEAIQSVLAQTLPPTGILIVDDGSTDDSAQIARAFGPPVRCLRQPNRGPAAARNLGVSQATGDLLAFLDADDLWTTDKLARQMQMLQADPACEAVLGRVGNFISPELDDAERRLLSKSATQTGSFHIGALLIRRTAFLRVGWFDTRWRQGEFIEWWARAARLNLSFTVLPELVLRRRLHTGNLMRRDVQGRADYLRLLRELLAQRRALAAQAGNPAPEQP
ncbi:MAG: glycosyltransferase family A protein [Chloroflexi bacterium]|nr:glycosyltransferase family A protein [Chloroflexota bacterium]